MYVISYEELLLKMSHFNVLNSIVPESLGGQFFNTMYSYYTQYLLMGGINIEKSSRGCLKGAVAESCCWKRHNWLHVGQIHALYEAVHRYICHDEYFTWKSIIYHKIKKIIKQTAQKFRRISSMGLRVT